MDKEIIKAGFSLQDTIIMIDKSRPCAVCCRMTRFMDYCFEVPLCSPKCEKEFTDLHFPKKGN